MAIRLRREQLILFGVFFYYIQLHRYEVHGKTDLTRIAVCQESAMKGDWAKETVYTKE